jgi:hypothetical protein
MLLARETLYRFAEARHLVGARRRHDNIRPTALCGRLTVPPRGGSPGMAVPLRPVAAGEPVDLMYH